MSKADLFTECQWHNRFFDRVKILLSKAALMKCRGQFISWKLTYVHGITQTQGPFCWAFVIIQVCSFSNWYLYSHLTHYLNCIVLMCPNTP